MVNKVTLIGDSENFTKYLVILLFQEPTYTSRKKASSQGSMRFKYKFNMRVKYNKICTNKLYNLGNVTYFISLYERCR